MVATDEMERVSSGKRRLIVHVGVQKTGSTSIQRHLGRNAKALSDRLVVRTPEEGTPMRPLGRAAVNYSLRSESGDTEAALKIALDDVLDTLPANDVPVLLSHENLAGAMPGNGGEIRLYPALPQIVSLIQGHAKDFDVDFVYYSRRMNAWKSSVWAQAVRTDGYTRREEEFMAETAELPGWGNLHRRLVEAVGGTRVTRFKLEDEAEAERPGRQLLLHAGLSDAEIDALQPLDGSSMSRLNDASTEFLRHLNSLNINPHARGKVADLVARTQSLFNADHRPEGTL